MPWAETIVVTFEIPKMHWMEDLMGNLVLLFGYFDSADIPAGWKIEDTEISVLGEECLLFGVDHLPTQDEMTRVEEFILTGK